MLPRLITAIVLAPFLIIALLSGPVPFFILILGILIYTTKEYLYLLKLSGYQTQPLPTYLVSLLLFFTIYLNTTKLASETNNQMTSLIVTIALIFFFLLEIISQKIEKTTERISTNYLVAFLLSWCFGHLMLLCDLKPIGVSCVLYLFVLIWCCDTSAYAFGTWFGKRKLASKVSPKKTIEGLIGAYIISIPVSFIFWRFAFREHFKIIDIFLLAIILVTVAQISDLAESLIKREAGVKDSDNLLPGHGGMLDRFDSFIFTTPLFYYYLTIIKRIT